jgi:hypothetical protein
MHGKQAKSESWEKCKLKTAKGYDDFQTRYVLLSNSPEDGPRTTGRPATCRYNNKSLARFLAMDTGVVILLLSSSTPCVAFASHDPLPCLAALLLFCPVSRARQAAAAGLGVAHSPLLLRGVLWDRLRLANHPPHYPAAAHHYARQKGYCRPACLPSQSLPCIFSSGSVKSSNRTLLSLSCFD